ncbi:MAG: GAF domain-containing protein [Anaerolineales bacterium]|nr:GAF domain-containing protein [Anaerolineales bacterium]
MEDSKKSPQQLVEEVQRLRQQVADLEATCQALKLDISKRERIEAENARLYDQAQRNLANRRETELAMAQRHAELLTLQYAAATLATSLDLPYILNTLTREITNFLGANGCVISEWDQSADTILVIAVHDLSCWSNDVLLSEPWPLAKVPLAKQVLMERRAQQIALSPESSQVEIPGLEMGSARNLLLLPMEFQGQVVGLIQIVANHTKQFFSGEAVALAQMLANQAASALQNAHLYSEVKQRLTEQIALQTATAAISSTLDLRTVLRQIAEQMGRAVDATSAYICSFEPDPMTSTVIAEYFSPQASTEECVSDLGVIYALPRDFSSGFQRLLEGQPEVIHSEAQPKREGWHGHMQEFGAKSILNIPLLLRGQVIAFAELWESRRARPFTVHEITLCQGIAQQAAIALEHARLYNQAQQEIKERARAEAELRRSEYRQRALLNAIPDVMFRATRTGQVLDYHRGSEQDSIWPAAMQIGQNLAEILPPEAARLTLEHIARTLESGIQQIFEYRWHLAHFYQDYETRLVSSGRAEVLGIVRNITERKRMEEQAMQAERLATLGRLSAALTHEINNPLQSMRGHLDLMLDFSASLEPGEDKKFLQIIRQEVVRLNDITQRILNLARPWPASRRVVQIIHLLRDVLILADSQLKQHDIQLLTEWQEVPQIMVAPDQLVQVFLNLTINAIEATPPKGLLRVIVCPDQDEMRISFINSGPTIPTDALRHIFEPFFTTKPEGSGLGLWVSQNLVRQHGGSITVENLENPQGVAFTVTLPFRPVMEVTDADINLRAN